MLQLPKPPAMPKTTRDSRPEAWEDKSVVLAAVSSCGWALRYASEELKNDQDRPIYARAREG